MPSTIPLPASTIQPTLSAIPGPSTHPDSGGDVQRYLDAVVDEQVIVVNQRYIHEQYGPNKAFRTIIFTRLVAEVCRSLGIPYGAGSKQANKVTTASGPSISIDDVVVFLGHKSQGNQVIAPTTFGNHRSLHLRAMSCVQALEHRSDQLSQGDQTFLLLLRKLLFTEFGELNSLKPAQYGSLEEMKKRVKALQGALKK